jgi:methyltransferase (TIGR00027 family)
MRAHFFTELDSLSLQVGQTAPKPSAHLVATHRAMHQILDQPPVFEDPLALKILGMHQDSALHKNAAQHRSSFSSDIRTFLALRSRVAEECWAQAEQNGVRQYVILGAGLDTYAYRRAAGSDSRVFEVDLPLTQHWKRDCLKATGIEPTGAVCYVPTCFEQSKLENDLIAAGFRPDQPAFYSWLGVTFYLEKTAIANTLDFIAAGARGGGLVFDYGVLPGMLTPRERLVAEWIAQQVADRGELIKTLFTPQTMADLMQSHGFASRQDLGPDELNARYLSGRSDDLRATGISRIMHAWT